MWYSYEHETFGSCLFWKSPLHDGSWTCGANCKLQSTSSTDGLSDDSLERNLIRISITIFRDSSEHSLWTAGSTIFLQATSSTVMLACNCTRIISKLIELVSRHYKSRNSGGVVQMQRYKYQPDLLRRWLHFRSPLAFHQWCQVKPLPSQRHLFLSSCLCLHLLRKIRSEHWIHHKPCPQNSSLRLWTAGSTRSAVKDCSQQQ